MTEKPKLANPLKLPFGGGVLDMLHDFRISLCSLRKSPGFTVTIVITLALCIGANTTVFSALHALVLKPLPFEDSDRIVHVLNILDEEAWNNSQSSWNQYTDFKQRADLFTDFALVSPTTKISDDRQLSCLRVTADFVLQSRKEHHDFMSTIWQSQVL